MPEKTPSPVIAFVVGILKQNPKASYAEVAEAAKKAGHKVVPINYGRARAAAGLAPKSGKGRARMPAGPSGTKRGPGRPRRDDELTRLVERLRQAERLEGALREIRNVVQAALG